jgi:hypothetical protein
MGPRRFTEKTPCRDDINADLAITLAMWFDRTVRRAKLAVTLTKTAKDRLVPLRLTITLPRAVPQADRC